MIKIFPSLISANLLTLEADIATLEPHSDGFHIDVMDNHFVPNLTWGAQFTNAFVGVCQKPLFVHLMITNPQEFIQTLSLRTIDVLCFHIETTSNPELLIKQIKEKKWKVAITLKPKTALSEIFPFLHLIDQVLLMSVEPGFSGQQFLDCSIERLDSLVQFRKEQNLGFEIVMDGGINQTNIGELAQKGAHSFGIAGAIFDAPDPIKAIEALRKVAKS